MSTYDSESQQQLQEIFQLPARGPLSALTTLSRASSERVQEIEWRATQYDLPMRCVGVAAPLEVPVVIAGQHSDWAVMRYGDDPNYRQHAGHPMPYEQIELLERMVAAGFDRDFDDIVIVHQLPVGVRANQAHIIDLEPVRAKYSPSAVKRSLRYGALSGTILQLAALPLVGAVAAGLVATGGALLAAAPVLAAATLLDPILFATFHDPHSGNEAWIYLTHWEAWGE